MVGLKGSNVLYFYKKLIAFSNAINDRKQYELSGADLRNLCRYAKSFSKKISEGVFMLPRAFPILGGGRTSNPLLYNMGDATHLQSAIL